MRHQTKHYSDTVEIRPRHLGTQRGPTTDTVLSAIPQVTDGQKRAAGLFVTSTAIRQGWTGDLAETLSMLGLTP